MMMADGNRSVAQERVKAVAETEEADLSRRGGKTGTSAGGWTTSTSRCTGGSSRDAGVARRSDPVSRLEHRLEVKQGQGPGGLKAEEGGRLGEEHPMARLRRNIQFLEECDRWACD